MRVPPELDLRTAALGIANAVSLLASGSIDTRGLVEPDDVGLHGMLDAMADLAAGDDDRVDFIGHEVEEFGDFLRLHNFYVRFLLPMMLEVQFFDWTNGMAPDRS